MTRQMRVIPQIIFITRCDTPHKTFFFGVTCYIKPKGMCDTRNEITRRYVQEGLVYKKVWKFRLSHQKRDRGDNVIRSNTRPLCVTFGISPQKRITAGTHWQLNNCPPPWLLFSDWFAASGNGLINIRQSSCHVESLSTWHDDCHLLLFCHWFLECCSPKKMVRICTSQQRQQWKTHYACSTHP